MICKNCGYENNDTSAFCAECGAPLAREEKNAPETPNEIPAEPVYAAPAAPEAPAFTAPAAPVYPPQTPRQPAPVYAAPQAPKPEKKSGKGGRIALIVTVVVLALALIAGCVFGYLLYEEKTREIKVLEADENNAMEMYQTLSDDYDTLSDDYNALSSKYDTLTGDYDELSGQYDELNASYEEMSEYANGLYEEYSGMYDEYWFFKNHAVFCSDMNKYYHTYDCEDWDRNGFWIYNLEAAKGKEFTACPKCMAESDADAN